MVAVDQVIAEQRETDPGVDYFVRRLALTHLTQPVVARADIIDAHGITLVRKDDLIDDCVADRLMDYQLLLGQRLKTPISQQIRMDTVIDGKHLFHQTYAMFGKYPDILQTHKHVSSDAELSQWTMNIQIPEALWQQLALMELQLPERFSEALFCAWFSALIATKLGCDDETVKHAYMAGLLRDVGFLHIPIETLEKTDKLSPAEWRAIQGHVSFSCECLLNAPGMPEPVIVAVAQHHERYDGSGYPRRHAGDEVSRLGLVVGLADTLQAMRFKQFARVGRGLYDAIPYLQMNGDLHSIKVTNAAVNILRASGLETTKLNPCSTVAEFAFNLIERAKKLLQQIGHLDQILDALRILPLDHQGQALIEDALNVHTMIVSSGLTRGELMSWLESMQGENNESILSELNELDLMLNELRWHVQKLIRSIDAFFDASTRKADAPAAKAVDAAITGLRTSAAS